MNRIVGGCSSWALGLESGSLVRARFHPPPSAPIKVSAAPYVGRYGIFEAMNRSMLVGSRFHGPWFLKVPRDWCRAIITRYEELRDLGYSMEHANFAWVIDTDLDHAYVLSPTEREAQLNRWKADGL